MKMKTEAVTPPHTISRVLDVAGEELVLVGGQALAFWVQRFDLVQSTRDTPAITNDMDFLSPSSTGRAAVRRLAGAIRGKVLYPNKRALTALIGQAYLEISDEEYVNIDVLWKLIGPASARVRERAILVRQQGEHPPFLVMHPLDVLHSRMINLHKLPEKQNDKGHMQLALAIDVARAFLRDEASRVVSH